MAFRTPWETTHVQRTVLLGLPNYTELKMNPYRFRLGLTIVVGIIGSYLLLVPPIIGLANESDFSRLMDPFGIAYPPNLSNGQQYWCFTDSHFIFAEPHESHFITSQFLFVAPAVVLNRLVTKPNIFDIRFLAALELAVLLLLFWRLSRLIQHIGKRGQWIGLAVLTLVVTDVRNLAFFNTFYCDQATFLFGLTFVLSLFEFLSNPSPLAIGFLTCASLLLTTAKAQLAPTGIVIAFCIAVLPFVVRGWHSLLRYCLPAAAVILATSLWFGLGLSSTYSNTALYNSVFNGLLFESDKPAEDLATLGINPAAVVYKDTSAWSPKIAGPELFPGTATVPKLFLFYMLRPKYLLRRTYRVITQTQLSNQLRELGNFERGYGYPCQAQTNAFSIWDPMRSSLARPRIVAVFFLVTMAAALVFAIRRNSPYAIGYLILGIMAIASFFVAALGDMVDRRHLVFFNFLFDCCICCTSVYAMDKVRRTWISLHASDDEGIKKDVKY